MISIVIYLSYFNKCYNVQNLCQKMTITKNIYNYTENKTGIVIERREVCWKGDLIYNALLRNGRIHLVCH